MSTFEDPDSVDLYWIPLGAGEAPAIVRWTGRVFEALAARRAHRAPCDLYHSALEVRVDGHRHVIEMAPVWGVPDPRHGVAGEGAVGLPWLGRSRLFRYEVRCWRDGAIPDIAFAVASPVRVSRDPERARDLLARVPFFPTRTWGRDEQGTGEMWNSNSLTSWLLAESGHHVDRIVPPPTGVRPGGPRAWPSRPGPSTGRVRRSAVEGARQRARTRQAGQTPAAVTMASVRNPATRPTRMP